MSGGIPVRFQSAKWRIDRPGTGAAFPIARERTEDEDGTMTTDRLATPDEAREAREIKDVVDRCRAAMPDAKALVVQELHRWVTLEFATHDPAHRPERRH
jgi:hypothetical protein